jgi:biopolymer transport protein ExbD
MEFRQKRSSMAVLEIAPLVDVVFLLLIFFMLTSSFVRPQEIKLELPSSESSTMNDDDKLIEVALDAKGGVFLDGEAIQIDELQTILEPRFAEKQESPVVVRSDASVQVERMVEVMDKIRLAGGSNVGIATSSREGK